MPHSVQFCHGLAGFSFHLQNILISNENQVRNHLQQAYQRMDTVLESLPVVYENVAFSFQLIWVFTSWTAYCLASMHQAGPDLCLANGADEKLAQLGKFLFQLLDYTRLQSHSVFTAGLEICSLPDGERWENSNRDLHSMWARRENVLVEYYSLWYQTSQSVADGCSGL